MTWPLGRSSWFHVVISGFITSRFTRHSEGCNTLAAAFACCSLWVPRTRLQHDEIASALRGSSETMATPAYNSPYRAFCREQRPLLPSGMKNSDREKALGQTWRELTNAGRATYHRGLKQEPSFGRGGLRVWAPVSLARLPTPTSGAVTVIFLAPGCAPVVSIAALVTA